MNRMLLIAVIALAACTVKSNAQTSVPFYGFELSNYEVGDSLEYVYLSDQLVSMNWVHCEDTFIYVITNKQVTAPDSILFHAQRIKKGFCYVYQTSYSWHQSIDTIPIALSNDSIYPNDNNFISVPIGDNSTTTPTFDTIDGLKHLHIYDNGWNLLAYDAKQNLGVTFFQFMPEDEGELGFGYNLIYARLQHYGVYGSWQPIHWTSVTTQRENASLITYDTHNKVIRISSMRSDDHFILYDLLGRCVLTSNIGAGLVAVGSLNKGIYFYTITGHQPSSGKVWIH